MSSQASSSRALREIHTLPQLVKYLHRELGWPIEADSFRDLEDFTFDWEPEELGIEADSAAKIEYIKQLRPLERGQPTGVFFIKFDTRRLPVVALRRVLGKLVIKKRANAAAAERPLWAMRDLVFISSYGESDERQLSFAYFQDAEDRSDLPTLKVLGWDNFDTPLHLDHVDGELRQYLTWPDRTENLAQWRDGWSRAFRLRHREVINTSRELSIRLAGLARSIRDRIKSAIAIETEHGQLTKLMKAFQRALIHDLDVNSFADMYAQTIAYGLLSARIADPHKKTADDFASHMRTNPFLRELMETFLKVGGRDRGTGGPDIDFDELGVNDVVELLDDPNTHMDAVVRDFGDRNPQEDPVIHFYEGFAKEYDPIDKVRRGEFYTPRSVVSYIVRSVDELLRVEFGLVDGLADTATWGDMTRRHATLTIPEGISPFQDFVQILDPATGTGTFLVEVIDLIHRTLVTKWQAQGHNEKKIVALWNEYVPRHLLTRLFAYELKMAPYAIAHLKVGLKLFETGYRFHSNERAQIYLTNALEPATDAANTQIDALSVALAHEATAVNGVKRRQRFTVVVGNPPYAGVSSNNSEYATRLVDAYKIVDGNRLNEKKLWLQDDYVKFLRAAQITVERAGCGVIGFITNHGYLDNPTFRGMRQSLLNSFQWRQVIDLHGNAKKKEVAPDGTSDVNVFDIQQGVAVGLFVRRFQGGSSGTQIFRGDLFGSREFKCRTLGAATLRSLRTAHLQPSSPFYLFVQQDQTYRSEFESMLLFSAVTQVHSVGVVTARDHLTIAFTPDEIWNRVHRFSELNESEAREEFELRKDVRDWKVSLALADIRSQPLSRKLVKPILYRPFDTRFIYYTGKNKGFIGQPATAIMSHMIDQENVGLMTTRKVEVGTFGHAICSRIMTESHSVSLKEVNYLFPLWLYPEHDGLALSKERRPNLSPQFLRSLGISLGIEQTSSYGLPAGLTPEDIFHYAYAVLHSPAYRSRYAAFLKTDFPRLPLAGTLDLFRAMAQHGDELAGLHLLESPKLAGIKNEFIGSQAVIERISWSSNTVWINKTQTSGFQGVREHVWNFYVGGYKVCEKWLKDRKGRKLSKADIEHYQKIVVALSETTRIMKEIDEVIERHGGWPEAFETTGHSRQG